MSNCRRKPIGLSRSMQHFFYFYSAQAQLAPWKPLKNQYTNCTSLHNIFHRPAKGCAGTLPVRGMPTWSVHPVLARARTHWVTLYKRARNRSPCTCAHARARAHKLTYCIGTNLLYRFDIEYHIVVFI